MSYPAITALFGGTFDPIHYGHLKPAISLAHEVGLSKIYLMPNNIPPHKPQPVATTAQRVEMLKRAIENLPLFAIDPRELTKTEPSYTIDTLIAWRKAHDVQSTLAFIIGEDSLATLNSWHRWQELLDYCHLLVCPRKGNHTYSYSDELKTWIKQHITHSSSELHTKPNGAIFIANTPLEEVSATEIRQRLANGDDCQNILPQSVWQYIQENQLYR